MQSFLSLSSCVLTGLASVAAADPSPTGREPRLLWTPERQAVWNRMKAEYRSNPANPGTLGGNWYKVVKENAECGCRYGDTGLWATLMYQWTGEAKYVDLAWAKASQFVKKPVATTVGNYIREYGMENVILLDWLWPGLSASQRTQLADAIAAMMSNSLKGSQPIRLGDSDQVVGTYFAVVLFHLANPDDPRALESFRHPQIGGLDATAVDFSNARNAIKTYVEQLAAGGEWFESAEYNLGTVNLLLMGAEAVRTAAKKDYFPEVTQWTPLWARRQVAYWTPDLAQVYQWGDEEHPRERRYYAWTNASGMAAGLLQGTTVGAQLQQHLLDLVSKYGDTGFDTMEPIVTGRLFFTFNPYAPAADWRTARTFHAKGTGLQGMSQAGVGIVIDKLLTDEDLRTDLRSIGCGTSGELCLHGVQLTRVEIDLFCQNGRSSLVRGRRSESRMAAFGPAHTVRCARVRDAQSGAVGRSQGGAVIDDIITVLARARARRLEE